MRNPAGAAAGLVAGPAAPKMTTPAQQAPSDAKRAALAIGP